MALDLPPTLQSEEQNMRRKIIVTPQNITSVPLSWLVVQLGKLRKQLRTIETPELREEIHLIEDFLKSTGQSKTRSAPYDEQQIVMDISVTRPGEYRALVKRFLDEYYVKRCHRDSIKEELESMTLQPALPTVTAAYGGSIGGGRTSTSPLEEAFIRKESQIELKQQILRSLEWQITPVEEALAMLKYEERELIERKFLVQRPPLDNLLIEQMHYNRQYYYEVKAAAVLKIAQRLKLV
ncbi:hypothetical protein ABEW34_21515 [Paenibacillus algorifonticola]|uniref:hypothetical protein n=1 Tax=Paenibacillus algorifonticola TaxID=684063 RepID=UPI003D2D482D